MVQKRCLYLSIPPTPPYTLPCSLPLRLDWAYISEMCGELRCGSGQRQKQSEAEAKMNADIVKEYRRLGVTDEKFLAVVMVWPVNRLYNLGEMFVKHLEAVRGKISKKEYDRLFLKPLRQHMCNILDLPESIDGKFFMIKYVHHYTTGEETWPQMRDVMERASATYSKMVCFPREFVNNKELQK